MRMRKRKRDLPFRLLKRLIGTNQEAETNSVRPAKPPEPMPEPPSWLKQTDGHDHHHDHSHDHDHGHSHDESEQKEDEQNVAVLDVAPPKTTNKKSNVLVDAIETPNPNAIKFSTNQKLTESSFSASSVEEAKKHPLAEALFQHKGVINVFGVNDFVTVLKSEDSDWSKMQDAIIETIIEQLS